MNKYKITYTKNYNNNLQGGFWWLFKKEISFTDIIYILIQKYGPTWDRYRCSYNISIKDRIVYISIGFYEPFRQFLKKVDYGLYELYDERIDFIACYEIYIDIDYRSIYVSPPPKEFDKKNLTSILKFPESYKLEYTIKYLNRVEPHTKYFYIATNYLSSKLSYNVNIPDFAINIDPEDLSMNYRFFYIFYLTIIKIIEMDEESKENNIYLHYKYDVDDIIIFFNDYEQSDVQSNDILIRIKKDQEYINRGSEDILYDSLTFEPDNINRIYLGATALDLKEMNLIIFDELIALLNIISLKYAHFINLTQRTSYVQEYSSVLKDVDE